MHGKILIEQHLSIFNFICQVLHHLMSESISLCSNTESCSDCIGRYNIQSSANNLIVQCDRQSGKSLMYVKNKSGPSTVPCGTPEVTNVGVEKEPSTVISHFGCTISA